MNTNPTPIAEAAAEVLTALCPARVAIVRDPLGGSLRPRDFAPVGSPASLADLAPTEPGAWLCQVDDRFVGREHWHYAPPPGSIVIFRLLPQGGGKGGSNPLRMILTIALMIYAPMLAPWLKLQGIAMGVSSALITTGAMVAGQALINNLVPVTGPSSSVGGGAQQFSASAQGNQARIGQAIPEIFGWDNGWPDLAAQPYSLYSGNEQYLRVLLNVGVGQYDIRRVSIGDTPLTSFAEATIVRIGPGQSTQSGPGTGYETITAYRLAVTDESLRVSPNITNSPDVSSVEMKTLDYVGPFAVCKAEREVTRIGIDILLPRGLDSSRTITWKVEYQAINDFDQPTGAWATLATESYSVDSVIPVRLSYDYNVAQGRYRVRLVRTDTRATSDGSAHDISWLAMRGDMSEFSIFGSDQSLPEDCTYVAILIRASGQLSGALRFRVMSHRMLPIWNGATWDAPAITRNPAWAFARVLKARDTADADIDLDQLLALAAVWDARQDRFDFRFDTFTSTWDALAMIARVGRAVPLIRGSKYTMARDAIETAPVALFGMRNIRRGTYRLGLAMQGPSPMTTLDLEYWDHRLWDWTTVTAQRYNGVVYGYRGDANRPVGVPAPDDEARGRIKMPGIIGENHAIRTAVYTMADGLYRRLAATLSTELDGLLPAPLSLVMAQHDVGNFGQGGDVADWDSTTRELTTTEPLAFTASASAHYLRLVRPTGALSARMKVAQTADPHVCIIDAADLSAAETAATADQMGALEIVFDDAARERSKYVFGPATNAGALAKVRSIRPRSGNDIELKLLLEDDRVHTADNDWLPTGEQDPVNDGSSVDADGSDLIVNLTSRQYNIPVLGGDGYYEARWRVTLHNDGRMSYGDAVLGTEDSEFFANEWLNPQTVTAALAGLYEVRFTALEDGMSPIGDITHDGDALDTWHSLATKRAVTMTSGSFVSIVTVGLLIEVRDVATSTVQDSCTIIFNEYDNNP
jgi:hypothetical protein